MRIVLLTGFEPFDQDPVNPSWEAVRQLDGVQLGSDVKIVARRLPCAFATAGECLSLLIDELHPAMVIATGLGPGRSDISVERVAININDARIPDNLGEQPIDTAVVADGPAAFLRRCRSRRWSRPCVKRESRPRYRRRQGRSCVIRFFICCSMRSQGLGYAVGLSTCRFCRSRWRVRSGPRWHWIQWLRDCRRLY